MKNRKTPEVCPVCGEDVPPKAKSCPECGACHESGWNEDGDQSGAITEHGYIHEEKFDYERWRAREEGREPGPRTGLKPFWRWVALGLLLAVFWYFWEWIYKIGSTPWF